MPRDAFLTPGRYPAGLSYPGTKRYELYGMWPPRDMFLREWDLHFSVARERGIRYLWHCYDTALYEVKSPVITWVQALGSYL